LVDYTAPAAVFPPVSALGAPTKTVSPVVATALPNESGWSAPPKTAVGDRSPSTSVKGRGVNGYRSCSDCWRPGIVHPASPAEMLTPAIRRNCLRLRWSITFPLFPLIVRL